MNKKRVAALYIFTVFSPALLQPDLIKAETTILKFSTGVPSSHAMQVRIFNPWAREVKDLSNGNIDVIFYVDGVLGEMPEQLKLAEKGSADITFCFQGCSPDLFPLTTAFELPFMIPRAELTSRKMWQTYEKFPAFQKEYKTVKLLALFCHPGDHFHTLSRPIRTLSDFKGMKIITENVFVSDTLKILGATPLHVPMSEARAVLSKGSADGIVCDWGGVETYELKEFLKYTTEAFFSTSAMMLSMNKAKYESLPGNIKKIIDKTTGLKMSVEAGEAYDAAEAVARQNAIKKGIIVYRFSAAEMQKLHSLIVPLRQRWVRDMEARGLPGEKFLQDIAVLYDIFKLMNY